MVMKTMLVLFMLNHMVKFWDVSLTDDDLVG